MMHADLCEIAQPRISVITPSLNHGRFLKATIDSIASQSYRNFEHIVMDGGSTDETVEILRQYPHIRWVSEPDSGVVSAYQKALAMARGEYVIQCCVSDGFLDQHWFRKCADVLDNDMETSLVWGLPQYMSEEGDLLNVAYQEFFNDPSPQKQEFLALWLANGFFLPEGNYCVRTDIIKRYFPDERSESHFQVHCHLGFMYYFMVQGYCPYFIPAVANFGRLHDGQRGERFKSIEKTARATYLRLVKQYRKAVLGGATVYRFRNGRSEVMHEIASGELGSWRKKMWRHQLLRSRVLRTDAFTLAQKVYKRIVGVWKNT